MACRVGVKTVGKVERLKRGDEQTERMRKKKVYDTPL